jgi:hypothetical protein
MSVVSRCRLENTTPPCNKYYIIEIGMDETTNNYIVSTSFGRIGVNKDPKVVFETYNRYLAERKARMIRENKIYQKGYHIVPVGTNLSAGIPNSQPLVETKPKSFNRFARIVENNE